VRNLVKAGALIAAEIDRMTRVALAVPDEKAAVAELSNSETAEAYCENVHGPTGATCDRPRGHDGPHGDEHGTWHEAWSATLHEDMLARAPEPTEREIRAAMDYQAGANRDIARRHVTTLLKAAAVVREEASR
jgi:hypothetical protein